MAQLTSQVGSIRKVDSKGRVMLGLDFKNTMVMVEERKDQVVLKIAKPVAAHEEWLKANPKAMARVKRGLAEAKKGRFSKTPPDIDADLKRHADGCDAE